MIRIVHNLTPGPWLESRTTVHTVDGRRIAGVPNKYNKRFIAAARNHLDILEDVLSLDERPGVRGVWRGIRALRVKVRAFLAEAGMDAVET